VLTGSRTALCGGKSEELCEDIPPNIGHCQRLLANGVVFALDRSVRDSAFVTFQDGSSGTARLSAAIKMTTAPATMKGNNARAVNGRPAHA
jgi:hypothetical protein